MDRRAKLLAGLDLAALHGVEFGPLNAPLVGKDESRVLYVDHLDEAALRRRYGDEAQGIVPLDAVWSGRPLRASLPDDAAFDYAVAAHVVEHVPDLIDWLQQIAGILRPGGVLGLVVPDKRFTFDYLRCVTRAGEVVDAHLRAARRPTPAQIYDFTVNAVEVEAVAAWAGPLDAHGLRRYADPAWALAESRRAVDEQAYVDVHCWVFTPDSLLSVFAELASIGLMPFACSAFAPTERNEIEFAIVLEHPTSDVGPRKLAAGFHHAMTAA